MNEQPKKNWTLSKVIEQLKSCGFECEAGPIDKNDAFIWLDILADRGPKYMIGQGVYYEVSAEVECIKLKSYERFFIVGIIMDSDTEGRTYKYNLSNDVPGPWHYGKTNFTRISESCLNVENPENETP